MLLLLALAVGGGLHAQEARQAERTCCGHCTPAQDPTGEVKNLIYMIGDGMGLAHVSMLMIENGYEPTAFDRMQNIALISTYSANNRVTDSAAAGTALATGTKTYNSKLGVDPEGRPLESILAKAVRRGMPSGVVVTCYLHHATPGAFYAHAGHRNDSTTIARDLVSSGLDVAFGGGRRMFSLPYEGGESYAEAMQRAGYRVVGDLKEAGELHDGKALGLFAEDHMPAAPGRGDYLPVATAKALEILSNNAEQRGEGFMLMVEGSQIDFASHARDARYIYEEMVDFDKAVAEAMKFVDSHPGTLLVVTADHETSGMSIPSNQNDFTLSESGITYKFGTGSHTGTLVPVYLYGTGAERINGVMDNTGLSRALMRILGVE